jgi:hypothetical protein
MVATRNGGRKRAAEEDEFHMQTQEASSDDEAPEEVTLASGKEVGYCWRRGRRTLSRVWSWFFGKLHPVFSKFLPC